MPLAAVFESRSQDFELEIISPHTSSVVGIIKVSLEPSSTEVPKDTVSFNVVMHHIHGLAEREGSEVHAQMFVPGLSATTTTNKISDFDEGPIKFESTHTISAPLSGRLRESMLRIAIFAKITTMHLEKLMSWDEMRDESSNVSRKKKRKTARLAETEFYTEEKHDIFGKIQVLELNEMGEYIPVEVLQHHASDAGAFQLHQGIQRRVLISLTHSSGDSFSWRDIANARISQVKLLDSKGKLTDSNPAREVGLGIVKGPSLKQNPDGSSSIAILTQWDSSLHNSLLLDRTTAPHYRIQVNLKWDVISDSLSEPMKFSFDLMCQIQSRLVRSPSKFMQLWTASRTVHAVAGPFQLVIKPAVARRAVDLWRMNTSQRYVKGEEYLGDHWSPRGVSLVRDFLVSKRRRMRVAEVEAAKGYLNSIQLHTNGVEEGQVKNDEAKQEMMLRKFVELWPSKKDPSEVNIPFNYMFASQSLPKLTV